MIMESMSINEVVDYINAELEKGRSMKDIEVNDFGVNERVLVKRLERRRVFKKDGRYVLQDEHNSPIADKMEVLSPKKSNNKNTKIIVREPMELLENEYFINLNKKVEMLEMAVKELMIRSNQNNNVNPEESTDFFVFTSEEKPVGKTVRLYPEIWDGLDKVRDIFPHLSAQTIINSLLSGAIKKYIK